MITTMITAMAISGGTAWADEFEPGLRRVLVNQIVPLTKEPVLIAAVKAQNEAHTGLDAAAIDRLDKQWRAEAKAGKGPLIETVLANSLSQYLVRRRAESKGLFLEIFVMDNKGLNVGQSNVTSDYWQGDEAKWQKSYGAGANGVLIDQVDFDDSAKAFVSQVSATIVDPADGQPIGAITIGVNVELVE